METTMGKILNKYRHNPDECDAIETAIARMRLRKQRYDTRLARVHHAVQEDVLCHRLIAIIYKYDNGAARSADQLFRKYLSPAYYKHQAAYKLYTVRHTKIWFAIVKQKKVSVMNVLNDAGQARQMAYNLITNYKNEVQHDQI